MGGGEREVAAPARPSWFRALARLWCLRAMESPPAGNPARAIAVLGTAWLAAWVVIDWWQRQPDPEWSNDGIPLLAWYALAILALAQLLRSRCTPRPGFPETLALALGLAPLPFLLMSVAIFYLEPPLLWWAYGASALYGTAFLSRGLRALTGRPQRAGALVGVAFAAIFIYASDAVNAIPDVWNPRDDGAVPEEQLAARETALFEQADRIDEGLESVQRDASPAPQAFFLGFAGVGEQKVFAQEIGLASRVIGERFGVGGRRLSLVNDDRDLDRAPIASVSGLRYALHGIAARMDRDRDILFLAISSHGSQDPAIAVSNSQFPLQSLSVADLADALEDSGIKWRVIIISACYAGGFIDSLRDPHTVVIAAAAADRTSFGCSNDSDLTYFGAAFYRDALPAARSLEDAFATARTAIGERERREHETPSDPQAYFGAEVGKKLAEVLR